MPDYMPLTPVPDTTHNPWSGVVADQFNNVQAANGAQAQLPGLQQDAMSQTQALNNYSGSTQSYPAMPNPYGLGSPPQATGPQTTQSPQASPTPDITSRGMTPWSLQGEALSR